MSDSERKLADEKERIEKDESVANHVSQVYYLLAGSSPTERMEKETARIRDDVNRLESASPAQISKPAVEKASRDLALTGGALIGTFIGFGSVMRFKGAIRVTAGSGLLVKWRRSGRWSPLVTASVRRIPSQLVE